jgi:hypothetical protein
VIVVVIPGWIVGPLYRVAPFDASPFTHWLTRDLTSTPIERARAVVRQIAEQIEREAQARDRLRAAPPAPPKDDRPVAPRVAIRKPAGTVRRGRVVYLVDKHGRLVLISPRERARQEAGDDERQEHQARALSASPPRVRSRPAPRR